MAVEISGINCVRYQPSAVVPKNGILSHARGLVHNEYILQVSPNIGFYASHANEESKRWSSAILKKKSAMQSMLEAQKTIEEIETDVSHILNAETLEQMRSMFFHDIPDSLDGQYLTRLERDKIQHSMSKNRESLSPLKYRLFVNHDQCRYRRICVIWMYP
jgi:hypothetical protein